MLELIQRIENLKAKNKALLEKQISNNFKVEVLGMEDYENWLKEQTNN